MSLIKGHLKPVLKELKGGLAELHWDQLSVGLPLTGQGDLQVIDNSSDQCSSHEPRDVSYFTTIQFKVSGGLGK